MPILSLKISGSPDAATRRELAETVTELTATILRKKRELTAVLVEAVDPDVWLIGGRTLAEHKLASFALTIKVTAGTNTKDEKAAYVSAVFERMSRLLGPLHEASYVVVEDVSADSWGYAGQTQEHRHIARLIQQA
jgi:4-oxalocrotonate tautomerase